MQSQPHRPHCHLTTITLTTSSPTLSSHRDLHNRKANLSMVTSFRTRTDEEHAASLDVALTVHKTGRHLSRFARSEEPYYHLADTNWALLHRLDMKETEFFLRNRAAKGFTAVMVVVVVQHG